MSGNGTHLVLTGSHARFALLDDLFLQITKRRTQDAQRLVDFAKFRAIGKRPDLHCFSLQHRCQRDKVAVLRVHKLDQALL